MPFPKLPYFSALAVVTLGLLAGRVTDITTGQGLAGVTVTIAHGAFHQSTRTDARGVYHFRTVPDGRYTIVLKSRDVPAMNRTATVHGATHVDLKACSTTLDYSCAGGGPSSGAG